MATKATKPKTGATTKPSKTKTKTVPKPGLVAEQVRIDLGITFRDRREHLRLAQRPVARRLRMDVSNLRKYEKGEVNITIDQLVRIAAALDADVVINLIPRINVEDPKNADPGKEGVK